MQIEFIVRNEDGDEVAVNRFNCTKEEMEGWDANDHDIWEAFITDFKAATITLLSFTERKPLTKRKGIK